MICQGRQVEVICQARQVEEVAVANSRLAVTTAAMGLLLQRHTPPLESVVVTVMAVVMVTAMVVVLAVLAPVGVATAVVLLQSPGLGCS